MAFWEVEDRANTTTGTQAYVAEYESNPRAASYVNITAEPAEIPFPKTTASSETSSVKHIFTNRREQTKVGVRFFSNENVQTIINNVRYAIFKRTKKTIDMMPSNDLELVMNNIFETHARYDEEDVQAKVNCLNNIVYEKVVDYMVSEIESYDQYIIDKSSISAPMPNPKNVSIRGRNTVLLKR